MTEALYVIGDSRDVVRQLPDDSIDFFFTSPPFFAVRSYMDPNDPLAEYEVGKEETPAQFLGTLLNHVDHWQRVMTPHGSISVELGDTRSGSGGAGGDYNNDGLREGQPKYRQSKNAEGFPPPKSKCYIPELFGSSLAYGRNLLDSEQTFEPWIVRDDITWAKPNPMPGAGSDRTRDATSNIVQATKSADRWYDAFAIRETNTESEHGAPPKNWWVIPTKGYKGSHYATMTPDVVERPVKSQAPAKVCRVCGEPSRRKVARIRVYEADDSTRNKNHSAANPNSGMSEPPPEEGWQFQHVHEGWSDCGHNAWRNGRVCDPFAGSGTTGLVATGLGRDFLGLDLDERNVDLARERIGSLIFRQVSVDEAVEWLMEDSHAVHA